VSFTFNFIVHFFIVLFSHKYIMYIDHFTFFHCLHSPFLLPLVSTPEEDLFLHSCPACFTFLSCMFQRGFTMEFHTWLYCSLLRLTPYFTLFSYLPFPHYSTAFSVFCYIIFIHRCSVFQNYLFSVFFSSPASPSPLKQPHYYIYYIICVYMCLCIHLFCRSSFHVWEKACMTFIFLKLAYFT
jgi:hypothetical protein